MGTGTRPIPIRVDGVTAISIISIDAVWENILTMSIDHDIGRVAHFKINPVNRTAWVRVISQGFDDEGSLDWIGWHEGLYVGSETTIQGL
jgi:hypothetical protein